MEPQLAPLGDAGEASWRLQAASTSWCTLRAASVVGVRHRLAGDHGEDWFAWSHGPGALAVAVADGVGSAIGSGGAARRASRASVEFLSEQAALAGDPALTPAERIESAVRMADAAARSGEGATTLLIALIALDGQVELGRVGDSTAFKVDALGGWRELFEAPDSGRVGSDTLALPADEIATERASTVLAGGETLVLASDGVADPWRDGPTTVAPSLAAGVLGRPSALELGLLADFSRQGCHDDRTLVCVWLRDSPAPEGDVPDGDSPGR
jgi:serine/threonine protein phosphatase PrpC